MCKEVKNEYPDPDPLFFDSLDYLMHMHKKIHTDEIRNTAAGHWINEAFMVRLWAVLEAHHFVHKIDHSKQGSGAVEICRHIRNQIAHATGETTNKKARSTQKKINEYFNLDDQESIFEEKFILSKDTVLRPMHADCIKYCKDVLSSKYF